MLKYNHSYLPIVVFREKIALTEQFIERNKREYEELQAELKEIGERA